MTTPVLIGLSKNNESNQVIPTNGLTDFISSSSRKRKRFTTSVHIVRPNSTTTTRQQQQQSSLSLSSATSTTRINLDSCLPSTSFARNSFDPVSNLNLNNVASSSQVDNNSCATSSTSSSTTIPNSIITDKSLEKDSQKSRCPYQPWNEKTIDHFFDALKQHGKDWEAIKKYIAQKSKTGAKNENQIRNFYHNTMRHLSRLINLNEIDAPKEAKELFMMVNYGELLKKTKSFRIPQHTFAEKFGELVRKGATSVKFRIMSGKGSNKSGKWLKVKTPVCPALKKYCDNTGSTKTVRKVDETKLPKTISIELSPKRNMDKGYVLDCCQNPLIRFSLSLSTPISEVLTFLQKKWIPPDVRRLKNQFNEDISDKLPTITVYPDAAMILRIVTISAEPQIGTTSSNFGLQHCFSQNKRKESDSNCEDAIVREDAKNLVNYAIATTSSKCDKTAADEPVDQQTNNIVIVPPSQTVQSVFDVYNSADSNDAPTTDDDGEPIEIDAFNVSQTEDFDLATDQIESQPETTAITLNPDLFRNGLSLVNCGDLTVGHLCLMCDGSSKLKLNYTIQSKVVSVDNVSPAWLCFVKLVKQEIAENLHRKHTISTNYNNAETASMEQVSPKVPVLKSPVEELVSAQSSMITPSRSKKKLPSKTATASATRLHKIAPAPIQPAPVVASESEAFFLQFQQMTRKPVVVTRLQAVTPVIAVSSTSTVGAPVSSNAIVFAQPVVPVQVVTTLAALPMTTTIAATSVVYNTPVILSSGVNNNYPSAFSNTKINPPVSDKSLTDFSLGSSSSLFGFSSVLSKISDKNVDGMKESSHLHNFDSFSFDSPLKTNSIDDNSLPRDVRRSFELMLHQDSIEYCKNFAALAGNLETPNKCRSPNR